MSIIKRMLTQLSHKENRCATVINRCIKLKDLDKYLENLDRQAKLLQKSNISIENNQINELIEQQNKTLLKNMQLKIYYIINNSRVSPSELYHYATKLINKLSNNMDMVDMEPAQSIQAYKTYIISNIILDNIDNFEKHQKTL